MWSNALFFGELFGTLFLAFGLMSIAGISRRWGQDISSAAKFIFQVIASGLVLMIAVYVAIAFEDWINDLKAATIAVDNVSLSVKNTNGHGFVNPAVAIMAAIGKSEGSIILPSLVGELVGAILGVILAYVLLNMTTGKEESKTFASELSPFVQPEKATKILFGEFFAATIFLGGIAASAVFTNSNSIAALTVGLSLIVALLIFDNDFVLLLNPAIGLAFNLVSLKFLWRQRIDVKNMFLNYSLALSANLSVASIIGLAYFIA